MELIFTFAIILCEICFINLFEVVKVVRAFQINALMDDEVFSILFRNQGVATVGAAQLHRRESAFIW